MAGRAALLLLVAASIFLTPSARPDRPGEVLTEAIFVNDAFRERAQRDYHEQLTSRRDELRAWRARAEAEAAGSIARNAALVLPRELLKGPDQALEDPLEDEDQNLKALQQVLGASTGAARKRRALSSELQREVADLQEAPVYGGVMIRVLLPRPTKRGGGLWLQGCFRADCTAHEVYEFVRSCVEDGMGPFKLHTPPRVQAILENGVVTEAAESPTGRHLAKSGELPDDESRLLDCIAPPAAVLRMVLEEPKRARWHLQRKVDGIELDAVREDKREEAAALLSSSVLKAGVLSACGLVRDDDTDGWPKPMYYPGAGAGAGTDATASADAVASTDAAGQGGAGA